MPSTANGVMSRWSLKEYEADTSRVRSTALKEFRKPQSARLYYLKHVAKTLKPEPDVNDHIQPEVDDLIFGNLFHEFLLDGVCNWFVNPHRRGTNAWKDTIEEFAPKWGVKQHQHDQLIAMRDSVMANPKCRRILEAGGFTEQTFLWDFIPDNGCDPVPAKMRCDWLADNASIIDLKTTRYSDRPGFEQQCMALGYDFSAAFYEMGRNSVPEYHDTFAKFAHIVVSKQPPYFAYFWPMHCSWLRIGQDQVNRAINQLAECRKRQAEYEAAGRPAIEAWPDPVQDEQDEELAAPDWYLASLGYAHGDF